CPMRIWNTSLKSCITGTCSTILPKTWCLSRDWCWQKSMRRDMSESPLYATQYSLWTHGRDETDRAEGRRESVKHLREVLQQSGAYGLSNAELIAIVLGTGPSTQSIIRQAQILVASTSLQELLTLDF